MGKEKDKGEWIPDERRVINGVMVHGDTTHAALLLQVSLDAADQFARDPHLPELTRLGDILTGEYAPPAPAFNPHEYSAAMMANAECNRALTQMYGRGVWENNSAMMFAHRYSGVNLSSAINTGLWLYGYESHDPS